MKKAIGRFLFDLLAKTVNHMDDETYDRFCTRTHRPAFARRCPLPKTNGQTLQFFAYPTNPDVDEGLNPKMPTYF